MRAKTSYSRAPASSYRTQRGCFEADLCIVAKLVMSRTQEMAAMKALHPLTSGLIVLLVVALQSVPAAAACNDLCQWKCRRAAANNLESSYDACVQQGGGIADLDPRQEARGQGGQKGPAIAHVAIVGRTKAPPLVHARLGPQAFRPQGSGVVQPAQVADDVSKIDTRSTSNRCMRCRKATLGPSRMVIDLD